MEELSKVCEDCGAEEKFFYRYGGKVLCSNCYKKKLRRKQKKNNGDTIS
ncbi:hypothetical protein ES703_92503 [subsurface metagenome]